jgi:hypothetical protein
VANLTLCARAICPSLLAAVILLSFSTTGFSHGDWPEGAHKEWFQNLQRPDNAQPPEPQLDPKSLFCCGAADVVKTKFKVEPAGGRCPDDVWYGWLNDTWTKVQHLHDDARRLFFDANNSPLSPRYLLQLLVAHRLNTTTKRWPGAKITLRNGARIIEKTWPADD